MRTETVSLTDRGTFTLPASVRKSLGIAGKQQFIVSVNEHGQIVLTPATVMPVEIYDDARVKEFESDDAEIGNILKKKLTP